MNAPDSRIRDRRMIGKLKDVKAGRTMTRGDVMPCAASRRALRANVLRHDTNKVLQLASFNTKTSRFTKQNYCTSVSKTIVCHASQPYP